MIKGLTSFKATSIKRGQETTYSATGGPRTREEKLMCMDIEDSPEDFAIVRLSDIQPQANLTAPEISRILAPIIRVLDEISRPLGIEICFREIENVPEFVSEPELVQFMNTPEAE
jgi:hypothetical protein